MLSRGDRGKHSKVSPAPSTGKGEDPWSSWEMAGWGAKGGNLQAQWESSQFTRALTAL